MIFGVYPGSSVGDSPGHLVGGPPDGPDRILQALQDLSGSGRPLVVRCYTGYRDGPRQEPGHAPRSAPLRARRSPAGRRSAVPVPPR